MNNVCYSIPNKQKVKYMVIHHLINSRGIIKSKYLYEKIRLPLSLEDDHKKSNFISLFTQS